MTGGAAAAGTRRPTAGAPIAPGLVLAVCCASMFVVALDSSIVNVALPAIGSELGAGGPSLSWVVDGYTLTLAGLLISSGVLADRFGRRRLFRWGLVVFAAGSAACGLAPAWEVLVGARVLQGAGASMLNPVALAIIGSVYPDPARRARAMGAWGAVLGIAMALGPVAGGLLTDAAGWRSIFWVNLPVCAVAVIAATRWVPESFGTRGRRLDLPGQLLAVAAMTGLVLLVVEASRPGPLTWVLLGLVVAVSATAVVRARRAPEPFVEPRYFRSLPFTLSTLCGLAASGGQGVLVFTLSVSLQAAGETPVEAGLHLVPIAAGTVLFSTLGGRAVARYGPVPPLAAGGALVVVSGLLLFTPGAGSWLAAVAAFCFGAGFGLVNAPITTTAVTGMGADAGAAGGVVSTGRQLGMSVGVAYAAAVAAPAAGWTVPSWIALTACGVVLTAAAATLRAGSHRSSREGAGR